MPAVSLALTTLRVLLAIYGLALAVGALECWQTLGRSEFGDSSERLAGGFGWQDVLAGLWCGWSVLAVLACAALVFCERATAWRWAVGSAAVLVGWQAVNALAAGVRADSSGAIATVGQTIWTLGDHAPRMAVPLAVAWIWTALAKTGRGPRLAGRLRGAGWLLATATAMMFLMHAGKLLLQPASVEELLTRSLGRWNGYQWSPTMVRGVLLGIGVVHLTAIIGIAAGRYRGPLCYMSVWGMMTALSRLSAYGLFAWDEAFLRAANGGAALAALFILPSREPCRDESRLHPKDRTTRIDSDR